MFVDLSLTVFLFEGAPIGSYQLHYTPGYSQSQIICLITDLYKGVPECFEVFHCRPSTTKEELHLFMERIKHHPLPYLVLEVNKLSFSLQEVHKYKKIITRRLKLSFDLII